MEPRFLLRNECGLYGPVQFFRHRVVVAYESFYELSTAIKYECLRNAIVVAEKEIAQRLVGKTELIGNLKLGRESRYLHAIIWSTHVKSDDLQTVGAGMAMKLAQVRDALATRATPSGIEIQNQNLAPKIR